MKSPLCSYVISDLLDLFPLQLQIIGKWVWGVKKILELFGGWVLTAHHHHRHRENLLSVCGWSDVAKPDGGETCHGEVERRNVQGVFAGPAFPLAPSTDVVSVRGSHAQSQLVEPAVRLDVVGGFIDDLMVPDAVPDAGEPVGHQSKDAHQQNQDGCSVLQIVIQLSCHSTQTQQADHFQGAEEAAETLQGGGMGKLI